MKTHKDNEIRKYSICLDVNWLGERIFTCIYLTPSSAIMSRFTKLMIGFSLIIIYPLTSAFGQIAQAANDPSKQKSIMVSNNPMRPLAVSSDGEWIMYGDGTPKLHRVSAKTQQESPTVILPASPMSISLSKSGQRAFVTTVCRGVALIDFKPSTPAISWIKEPHNGCVSNPETYSFNYLPAALSSNGEMYASYGPVESVWKIRIHSSHDNKPLFDFPLAKNGTLMHLEFLPDNRFFLIVESSPVGEGPPYSTWDLVYSIWDMENKQLRNSAEIRTVYDPSQNAFLSMSYFSDEGWAMRQTSTTVEAQLVRFPLRGCSKTPGTPNVLTLTEMVAQSSERHWAADNYSRWMALGRDVKNPSGEMGDGYIIEFFDINNRAHLSLKKPIAKLTGTSKISQMLASPDGKTLWVTLVDGRLERFDVPNAALHRIKARAKPVQNMCTPPDEVPNARLIDNEKPTHTTRKIYEKSLSYTDMKLSCPVTFRIPATGTVEGVPTIDYGPNLSILDPITGDEVRDIPTPASMGICAITMPEISAFITYQNDTVAIQPWSGKRRVIASRPGWKVALIGAGYKGGYQSILYVTWEKNSVDDNRTHASGISAAYSLKTWKLIREVAATYCDGKFNYPVVSCERTVVKLSGSDLKKYGVFQKYIASVDNYKRLTVRDMEKSGKNGVVVFRHGVNGVPSKDTLGANTTPDSKQKRSKKPVRFIAPYYLDGFVLNDHLVLGIKGASADLFDFRSHRLVGTLNESLLDGSIDPVWHEKSGTLSIVSHNKVLQGWRIERDHGSEKYVNITPAQGIPALSKSDTSIATSHWKKRKPSDLRHCLMLKSNYAISKCANETK